MTPGGSAPGSSPADAPTWPAAPRLGWPAATGIGSMPGTDVAEASRTVLGELGSLPHLPELPARGPGADMVGRAAGLLSGMSVDLQPAGWRIVDRPGRDARQIADFWARDVDTFCEQADGWTGSVKLQVAGPWTLAAALEHGLSRPVLDDHGATRDLAASLAEGVALHVADVRRRLPHARVLLQLDEPTLPAVLAGALPSASGWGRLRRPDEATASTLLRTVLTAATDTGALAGVHCCAVPPLPLLVGAGAGFLGIDLSLAGAALYDSLAGFLDGGGVLLAGAVRALPRPGPPLQPSVVAARVSRLLASLGFTADALAGRVVVTPDCGLAGVTPDRAREVMTLVRDAAAALAET